jgi:hypothetical protein
VVFDLHQNIQTQPDLRRTSLIASACVKSKTLVSPVSQHFKPVATSTVSKRCREYANALRPYLTQLVDQRCMQQ